MLLLRTLATLLPLLVVLAEDVIWSGETSAKLHKICDPHRPAVAKCCNVTTENGGTKVNCTSMGLFAVPARLPLDAVELLLKSNRISRVRSKDLQKLSKLTRLDLSKNCIETLERNAFSDLGELEILSLKANSQIELTAGLLKPLRKLRILELQKNKKLEIAQDAFLKSHVLQILDASYSGLRNITFLKSLRQARDISKIYLGGSNKLGVVKRDLFAGLSSPGLNLKLERSGITDIQRGAFASVHLKYLDLSHNPIGDSLPGVLQGLRDLENLTVAHVGLADIQVLRSLQPERLKHLDIAENGFEKIENGSFTRFGNLVFLNLSNNPLPRGVSKDGFRGLVNLRELYIKNCTSLTSFPVFTPLNSTESFTPRLQKLYLAGSPVVTLALRSPGVFNGLETLKALNLAHTFVRGIILDKLKYLETLYLSHCCLVDLPKINSTALKKLYIGRNEFYFDKTMRDNWNVPNLEVLDIRLNKFNKLSGQDAIDFISIFTKLKKLDMTNMGLHFLQEEFFDQLGNLEYLSLSLNQLGGNMTARWFRNLTKLQYLGLRDTRITTICIENFPSDHTLLRQIRLDLRDNPYNCGCKIEYFYDLIKKDVLILVGKDDRYTCKSPQQLEDRKIRDFLVPDYCDQAYILRLSLSLSGTCLASLFIGLALLHRYRWHIRFKLFKLKMWYYHRHHPNEVDGSNYKYDFHVHYDDDDVDWVLKSLLPELEEKRGYRLHVRHRDDMTVGGFVLDGYLFSIKNSYKTILCISNQFIRNDWSPLLLNLYVEKLLKSNKNIVVCLLLEEIGGGNLLETLESILTEKSYIRLPEDRTEAAMEYFWTRLDQALRQPVVPHRSSLCDGMASSISESQPLLESVC